MTFDDIDELEEQNNLNIKVIELIEEKTSTQIHVSENMNKNVVKITEENKQMSNHEGNLEDKDF